MPAPWCRDPVPVAQPNRGDRPDHPVRASRQYACRETLRGPDLGTAPSRGAGEASDAAPGEAGQQPYRGVLVDGRVVVEPGPGADLRQTDEPYGEQVGLVRREPGVLGDHLGDEVGAAAVR